MPLIKPKPSLNHQVIKNMTKQDVIDMHPGADEDHISNEWERATGKQDAKPVKSKKE